jgi:lipopolysaccharide biosynthesis glycosyltransferase
MKFYIGWDSREVDAYEACLASLEMNTKTPLDLVPLKQKELIDKGLYYRPKIKPDEGTSTEFTFTRFLIPHLNNYKGWALFSDCDFVFNDDVNDLFALADDKYALMVVKHDYSPSLTLKMDNQKQLPYPRKNWSSLMLINCGHEVCKSLTLETVNNESGAFLHRFDWCPDELIGEIPLTWNWLEGEYKKTDYLPSAIHYTNGGPWFKEVLDSREIDFADVWTKYYNAYSRK